MSGWVSETSIPADSKIEVADNIVPLTVRPNDNILFEAPSFITQKTYGDYSPLTNATGKTYRPGQIYVVEEADKAKLTIKGETLPVGTYFRLAGQWANQSETSSQAWSSGTPYIPAQCTVETLLPNQQTYGTNEIQCMWHTDNQSNVLFPAGVKEITLGQNQWFIYRQIGSTTLNFLGAGTRLTRGSDVATIARRFDVNVDLVQTQGASAVNEDTWYTLGDTLTVQEMEIITVGEGGVVTGVPALPSLVNNEAQSLKDVTVQYGPNEQSL